MKLNYYLTKAIGAGCKQGIHILVTGPGPADGIYAGKVQQYLTDFNGWQDFSDCYVVESAGNTLDEGKRYLAIRYDNYADGMPLFAVTNCALVGANNWPNELSFDALSSGQRTFCPFNLTSLPVILTKETSNTWTYTEGTYFKITITKNGNYANYKVESLGGCSNTFLIYNRFPEPSTFPITFDANMLTTGSTSSDCCSGPSVTQHLLGSIQVKVDVI